jgi:hypothetical protein
MKQKILTTGYRAGTGAGRYTSRRSMNDDDDATIPIEVEHRKQHALIDPGIEENFVSMKRLERMHPSGQITYFEDGDITIFAGSATVHVVGLVELSIGRNDSLYFFVVEELSYDFVIGVRDSVEDGLIEDNESIGSGHITLGT